MNAFLYHGDRLHYDDAFALRKKALNSIASQNALCAIDPLVYDGREILFNKVSELHTDSQDPPYGWAVLTAFGTNTPVTVSIPALNLRMSFKPGDMIALRGRVLQHETSAWDSGQRIVIPHFTHSRSWRAFGIESVFSPSKTS